MTLGFIGGISVAIGGAIKDVPAEGFKLNKFIRSPLAGIVGGFIATNYVISLDLAILSAIGFERVVVEFYKTFLSIEPRGIFRGMKPKYPVWFSKRWIFFVSYSTCVIVIAFLLFF